MQPIKIFALQSVDQRSRHAAPRSRLLREGHPTGSILDAARIEAQFALPDNRYLLFLSDDTPYEERIQVVLLSPSLDRLDGLSLGAPYNAGMFAEAEPAGDNEITFEVHGHGKYLLTVHAEPRRTFMSSNPRGVHRIGNPLGKHYLEIKRAEMQHQA